MAQLAQIQITYVANEDRLLMRLATRTREEFRFWLTRRFVKALRPALGQSLAPQARLHSEPDPQARREVLRFEHAQAVQSADFTTPYLGDAAALPLGRQPLLLTRMQIRTRPDGGVVLALASGPDSSVDIALGPALMHSFLALLEQALRGAGWDLPVTLPVAPGPAVPASIN
jgi:hypothetical protein